MSNQRVLTPTFLTEMYNEGLKTQEMQERVQAKTGEKISAADLRRLYAILGLDLRKKPVKPKWALEIEGQIVYETTEKKEEKGPVDQAVSQTEDLF